ncbi:MAG: hypothetical protein QXJ32_04870 [Thermoplasmata archaeon]
MIVARDLVLGILLGVSLSLLIIVLVSYRRSGARAFLPAIAGLSFHISLTVVLMWADIMTGWLEGLEPWVAPLADGLVLLAVLLLGVFGGRAVERAA